MTEDRTGGRDPVVPHWYSREDVMTVTSGEGVRVTDDEGETYLDFLAQLYCVNAGHSAGSIVDAMAEQARTIPYVSSSKDNDARTALARRLAEVAPGDLSDVHFAISGSEANEAAAHIAREFTGGRKVLTRYRSYHGSTVGTASFTGDPTTRNAVDVDVGGSAKFLPPLTYRSPFDGDTPEEVGRQAADHLEYVIRNEGADSVAAVLTEPVGGASGAYTAPPGYFERVREICDEYDVLLIADEVITGFGRCGDWFGIGTEGVVPDMITFAKGVTSAYVPLGGVVASPEIGTMLREEGIDLGQTFAGHPVACAAGVAAMDLYGDGLIANARELEPALADRLGELARRHDEVGDVRGRGLLWAVEFTDPATGEPFLDPWIETDPDADNPVETVVEEAADRGLLVGSGRPPTQVLLAPPLCVDEADVEGAVETLDAAIEATTFD
ncbi:MAG: aspartate aminotransferase family protein [Haloferacaceae archaeon]